MNKFQKKPPPFSKPMSSYLVAMLVADYASHRAPVVWPPPDDEHPVEFQNVF